jgi:two-component system response regulator (stage 0 sporulation protein F)
MQWTDHQLLITDDDDAFRATLGDALSRKGFRTRLACDGMEALQVIEHGGIHLALFDVHMPRLDGLGVLQSIRDRTPRLPCILMSAKLDDGIIARAQELGAEAILPKPFSISAMVDAIRRLLEATYGRQQ